MNLLFFRKPAVAKKTQKTKGRNTTKEYAKNQILESLREKETKKVRRPKMIIVELQKILLNSIREYTANWPISLKKLQKKILIVRSLIARAPPNKERTKKDKK